MFCPRCGSLLLSDDVNFCPKCGTALAAANFSHTQSSSAYSPSQQPVYAFQQQVVQPPRSVNAEAAQNNIQSTSSDPSNIAARIRQREKVVSIIWLVIGVAQLFFGAAAIVGVWNIINAILLLINTGMINPGNAEVIKYFKERLVPLIIAAILNLVIGGVIGTFLAGYELYIRKTVLDNHGVFETESI